MQRATSSSFQIFDEGLESGPPAKKQSLRNENTITSTPKGTAHMFINVIYLSGFKHILQQEIDDDDTMDPSAFTSLKSNFSIYQEPEHSPKIANKNTFKTPITSQRPKPSLRSSGKLNSTLSNETFELSPLHVTSSTSSSFSYSPMATPKTQDLHMHSTSIKPKQNINLSFPSPLGVVLSPSASKTRSVMEDSVKIFIAVTFTFNRNIKWILSIRNIFLLLFPRLIHLYPNIRVTII
jgi:hypothetical protein